MDTLHIKRFLVKSCLLTGSFFCAVFPAHTQTAPVDKQVNQQVQTWFSINSTMHFSDRWGLIADFHVRRNNFLSDPSFYFVRAGANYWIRDKFTVAGGYAHLWLAPNNPGWKSYVNEHRLYQQALLTTQVDRTGLLIRFRNEQRWQQLMANDRPTGEWRFTNRVRYLISFSFPLSRSSNKWALVAADEVLLNFGNDVLYNTFDQNRIFIGLRNKMSKNWSYDIGYMNVYQQRIAGYLYDMNHTFRWFFYYSPDFRKSKAQPRQLIDSREE
jgi:hypothetical protein